MTACPRNCYSTCGLSVEVEGGRLRRIEALPTNLATAEGPCLKGLSYVERVHSPRRIVHPWRRRADGGFERVSTDVALDEIARRLGAIRDESGPRALLHYTASGTKGLLNGVGRAFWRAWGGCTSTYGDLCWPAGLEATRLTLGANTHNAPWDLENARLILLWGKNAAETNVHQMRYVARAREHGAKIVVIDPRRTETAEHADLLLQPRPGSDLALALALAHVLTRDGRIDHEFVERHVLGYEQYSEMVGACTPEWAAAITGVGAEWIEEVGRLLGSIRPVSLCAGFGMQRYTNSGQTMRAMIALLALTGNLGRAGAGWIFANLQSAIFDEVKDPIAFYPPVADDGVERCSISTARLGADMLAQTDPGLRAVWVERGNPLSQNPDTTRVREAFAALELVVVVDQWWSDTARAADFVLPAKSFVEQSDVIGAYWHPYLQWKAKILDPPGEVMPETEIYRALGPRLGLGPEALAAILPGPSDGEVEAWLEARLRRVGGPSVERLKQGPVLSPDFAEVAFADRVFPTPSGRVELRSEEARQRWGVDELPRWVEAEAFVGRQPEELHLLTPNTKDRIHSQFHDLESIPRAERVPTLGMHPGDARVRGIGPNSRVRVFNAQGEVRLGVRLESWLRRGCVVVTNGWQDSHGAAVNLLSRGRETDLGHGAAFHDVLVRVEALSV